MNTNYRIFYQGKDFENRLYHFVIEQMNQVWKVLDDHVGNVLELPTKHCVVMEFVGRYDDTMWSELSYKEQAFWVMKGLKKANWPGKMIYERDIVLVQCRGRQDLETVIKKNQKFKLLNAVDGSEDDLPYDQNVCTIKVKGNDLQDYVLYDMLALNNIHGLGNIKI